MDTNWYKKFCKHGAFETYEFLDGDIQHRKSQRELFLKNKIEHPTLDYPLVNIQQFQEREKGLLKLKEQILKKEINPEIRSIYQEKINEKIADCRMLLATKNQDHHAFEKYNLYVYKPVDDEVAYKNLILYLDEIKNIENEDASIQRAFLKSLLDQYQKSHPTLNLPSHWKDFKKDFIGKLVYNYEFQYQEELQSADLLNMFKEALEHFGIKGWKVEHPKSSKSSVSVNQSKKLVNVPLGKHYTRSRAIELVLHEIGTHVLRREKGQDSKLKLSQIGLARYEAFEEGLAKLMEHGRHSNRNVIQSGIGHLAISMARGMYNQSYNFREIFECVERHFKIHPLHQGLGDPTILAWVRTVRTFRGTNCNTEGICYLKDKVYFEGIFKTIEKLHDMADFNQLFKGKIDFSNTQQVQWLEKLGVINR